MNTKAIDTLEFQQIKNHLKQYLVSAAGERELAALSPVNDRATIQQMLDETTDGADILRLEGGIPLPQLKNIAPQMKRLKVQASLNGTELAQITAVLQASMAVKNFFARLA